MKLYYYTHKSNIQNFGDDINPWLFYRLFPKLFNEYDETIFIGIGTILSDVLDNLNSLKVVFSSGVGYGPPPKINNSWKIYCVRGPLTAQKLGIANKFAITDGAALIANFYQQSNNKIGKFGFMPHLIQSLYSGDLWKKLCKSLGIIYIDPQWPVERVLENIAKIEILITEALHGAIVADALRIPWIPVISNKSILQFKWNDWCTSIQKTYNPERIYPLWDTKPANNWKQIKTLIKVNENKRKLKNIMKHSLPQLADQNTFKLNLQLLNDKCLEVKKDNESGLLY